MKIRDILNAKKNQEQKFETKGIVGKNQFNGNYYHTKEKKKKK